MNGVETVLGSARRYPGVRISWPGEVLHLRFRATGTGSTVLSGKAWWGAPPEPRSWQVQTSDSTASLQQPAAWGVHAYLSSSATNAQHFTVTADNRHTPPGPDEGLPFWRGTRRVVPRHWRALRARRASRSPKIFIAREV